MKMVQNAVRKNLNWFLSSRIMFPSDGCWGVAERLAVKDENASLERILEIFPAFTELDDCYVIEPRRADCNFQTAWLFLKAEQIFPGSGYGEVGRNILDFLYCRSGLLERGTDAEKIPGSWNWSHILRESNIWYDDQSWCLFLQRRIAKEFPELDRKYNIRRWAELLTESLYCGVTDETNRFHWYGDRSKPHFFALAAMALAESADDKTLSKYAAFAENFYNKMDCPNVSEHAYALIGAVNCARKFDKKLFLQHAEKHAGAIIEKIDPETGIMPAEHHEAPCGKSLADLIYTLNWALIGLRELDIICPGKYRNYTARFIEFLCRIQDDSASLHFYGCWRGMYDLANMCWGGGDRHEGGANSIYSGWTNAPICSALLLECNGESMFE